MVLSDVGCERSLLWSVLVFPADVGGAPQTYRLEASFPSQLFDVQLVSDALSVAPEFFALAWFDCAVPQCRTYALDYDCLLRGVDFLELALNDEVKVVFEKVGGQFWRRTNSEQDYARRVQDVPLYLVDEADDGLGVALLQQARDVFWCELGKQLAESLDLLVVVAAYVVEFVPDDEVDGIQKVGASIADEGRQCLVAHYNKLGGRVIAPQVDAFVLGDPCVVEERCLVGMVRDDGVAGCVVVDEIDYVFAVAGESQNALVEHEGGFASSARRSYNVKPAWLKFL